jgi:hydrogenase expression/formation protein HypC
MCLGIPGKVIRWLDHDPIFARAEIEFAGVCRVCQMACVPEASEGDYVIVHAGVAISRIDQVAAAKTLAEIGLLEDDGGWRSESPE